MFLLDTDHVSLLEWGRGPDARRLRERLAQVPIEDVYSSIISYEEQTKGWFALLAQANTTSRLVAAYERVFRHLAI